MTTRAEQKHFSVKVKKERDQCFPKSGVLRAGEGYRGSFHCPFSYSDVNMFFKCIINRFFIIKGKKRVFGEISELHAV